MGKKSERRGRRIAAAQARDEAARQERAAEMARQREREREEELRALREMPGDGTIILRRREDAPLLMLDSPRVSPRLLSLIRDRGWR